MKKGKRWIIVVFLVAFLFLGMTVFVKRDSISGFIKKVFSGTETATVQHMSFLVLDGMNLDMINTNGTRSDADTGAQISYDGKRYTSEGFVYSVMYYDKVHLATYLNYDSSLTSETIHGIQYKVKQSVAEEDGSNPHYYIKEYYTSTANDFYCISFVYEDSIDNQNKITEVLNSVTIG